MVTSEQLSNIIASIGPQIDDVVRIFQGNESRWTVQFSDIDIDIEFDEAEERLHFSTVVGPLLEWRKIEILELLLTYSLLYKETGGVRMAMTSVGGDVVQLFDVMASRIDPGMLTEILSRLVENTKIWQAFFSAADLSATNTAPQLMLNNWFRI
ncbi:type III secretion system chaperone [Burkholderia ubonensis]|uniref:type III secretion system chaperone n=1 Tax=Burkholderia ubonensis TaxID=101571 RepID=UPI00076CA520|nr:type III secretion system chaperone [Burkholderia ubonensis]KVZ50918.1 hypothetical protein WL16_17755 [Burkholderia ubonensis]